jgi:hypothetical protein
MRSGACDNERLKILHVMLEDIIAVTGGIHDAIGVNDDDDDDDKNTGKRKQITARVKPTHPRIFLIHALNTWRYAIHKQARKKKEFGKKIIFFFSRSADPVCAVDRRLERGPPNQSHDAAGLVGLVDRCRCRSLVGVGLGLVGGFGRRRPRRRQSSRPASPSSQASTVTAS